MAVKWMLTITFRSRPGNSEWQFKTIISHKPPEQWLTERLDAVEIGDIPKLEVNILYAREITEDTATELAVRLQERDGHPF